MSTKTKTSGSNPAIDQARIAPIRDSGIQGWTHPANRPAPRNQHPGYGDSWLQRTDDAMFANYYDPSF